MNRPPDFVRVPGGPDAVAEYLQMMRDVGEEAGHLLAELIELQNFKTYRDIPGQDLSATADLFIRYLHDWAVFYTARRRPFEIVVLHIAPYRREGTTEARLFQAAHREGCARLAGI